MGQSQSIPKIGFEDMQMICSCSPSLGPPSLSASSSSSYIMINTLPIHLQHCIIPNTLSADQEEQTMNRYLKTSDNSSPSIVIYGKNSTDETVVKKYIQITGLGFQNVYIYSGGMFEWLLLQDIYGKDEFPTTSKELDILKYKPNKIIGVPRIM